VGDLVFQSNAGEISGTVTVQQSADATRAPWWTKPIVGDSGSPCGTVIGGNFVAVTDWFGSGSGPCYSDCISAITTAIAGSGYTLAAPDLSSFNTY